MGSGATGDGAAVRRARVDEGEERRQRQRRQQHEGADAHAAVSGEAARDNISRTSAAARVL